MTFQRVGSAFRAVRLRKGLRQSEVSDRAGVSRWIVGQIERGRIGRMPLDTLLVVASVLDIRVDVLARWQGGDLGRLLDARHAALGELVARYLSAREGWVFVPEVSFSIAGERGAIDIFAWHAATRSLLVIELKTEIVDVQDTISVLDRKRRLAARVARDRGWYPATVSVWLIVADGTTNRRRIAAHRSILRAAFPDDGRQVRRWLTAPSGAVAGLSLWSNAGGTDRRRELTSRKRVRVPARQASPHGSTMAARALGAAGRSAVA